MGEGEGGEGGIWGLMGDLIMCGSYVRGVLVALELDRLRVSG